MTIRKRVWINLSIVNVCALALVSVAVWSAKRTEHSLTWASGAHAHRDAALQALLRTERLVRVHANALTGAGSFDEVATALRDSDAGMAKFQTAAEAEWAIETGDENDDNEYSVAAEDARLENIRKTYLQLRGQVMRSRELVNQGRVDEAVSQCRREVQPTITLLSDTIHEHIEREDEEVAEQQVAAIKAAHFIAKVIGAGALGLVALSILGLSTFSPVSRMVMKKIDALVAATQALASGNLKHRIDDLGSDELGQLATHFNEMAEQLRCQRNAMEKMQRELMNASRQTGMAEIATSVLHNVGNVLNSASVAATVSMDGIRRFKIGELAPVVKMLNDHPSDIAEYLGAQNRGVQLAKYMSELEKCLNQERESVTAELNALSDSLDHIKSIIVKQQQYARYVGVVERVDIAEAIDDALKMDGMTARSNIRVVQQFADVDPIATDRHRLMEILLNLLSNARHAIQDARPSDPRITLRIESDERHVRIALSDNGIGIKPTDLPKIFAYGFTTKPKGHGFGLHGSALAAKGLGGTLTASSAGAGRGATFVIEIPRVAEVPSDPTVMSMFDEDAV